MLVCLLALTCFAVAREIQLVREVTAELHSVHQSLAQSATAVLATFAGDGVIQYCILSSGKCDPRPLAPGSQSLALGSSQSPEFTVVAATDENLSISRLTDSGTQLFQLSVATTRPREITGLVVDRERTLVLWTADSDIYGCVVDSTGGSLRCGFVVNSFTQGEQFSPSGSFSGGEVLVVWQSSGYHFGLFAQRMSPDCTKIATEIEIGSGSGFFHPAAVADVILAARRSDFSAEVTVGFFSLGNATFTPIASLQEFHIYHPLQGKWSDSELVTLIRYSDLEARGRIRVQKTTLEGCLQNRYYTGTDLPHSHTSGQLLEVSQDSIVVGFYDQVRQRLTVQTLTNPPHSVCVAYNNQLFPAWSTPSVERPPAWKRIVTVAAACVAFVLLVCAGCVAVKLIRRRKHLQPPHSPALPQESQDRDTSSILFEIGSPS